MNERLGREEGDGVYVITGLCVLLLVLLMEGME